SPGTLCDFPDPDLFQETSEPAQVRACSTAFSRAHPAGLGLLSKSNRDTGVGRLAIRCHSSGRWRRLPSSSDQTPECRTWKLRIAWSTVLTMVLGEATPTKAKL